MRSCADSSPTDSRTRFGGAANGASAVDACVIRAGCSIRLSTPPRDSASSKPFVRANSASLDTAHDEPGGEWARDGPERLLQDRQPLGDRRIVGRGETPDDVGMSTEILGRRVDDDVAAELERALKVRGGERVVDDDK